MRTIIINMLITYCYKKSLIHSNCMKLLLNTSKSFNYSYAIDLAAYNKEKWLNRVYSLQNKINK